VKKEFGGKVIWDGIVEVFQLHGHPKAPHAYAWAQKTDDPANPVRNVPVLKIPPAVSPITAVRAAIVRELQEMKSDAEREAEAS